MKETISLIGQKILNYSFLELIGSGGTSNVYKVFNHKYNQIFAAKVTPIYNSQIEDNKKISLKTELNYLSNLDHPNIIRIYDSFHWDSLFILILEYCPNGSLFENIEKNGTLKEKQFLMFAQQIASSLVYSHNNNIVHRDIKPQNILFDNFNRPKLVDFGLSCYSNNELLNNYSKTLAYSSPEIIHKIPFDPYKSDIWSLGITFYYSLVGSLPFFSQKKKIFKEEICSAQIIYPFYIKSDIKELLQETLNPNPNLRINCYDVLKKIEK